MLRKVNGIKWLSVTGWSFKLQAALTPQKRGNEAFLTVLTAMEVLFSQTSTGGFMEDFISLDDRSGQQEKSKIIRALTHQWIRILTWFRTLPVSPRWSCCSQQLMLRRVPTNGPAVRLYGACAIYRRTETASLRLPLVPLPSNETLRLSCWNIQVYFSSETHVH